MVWKGTFFLFGRATRGSRDGAAAVGRGISRAFSWTIGSARSLNPFAGRKPRRRSGPRGGGSSPRARTASRAPAGEATNSQADLQAGRAEAERLSWLERRRKRRERERAAAEGSGAESSREAAPVEAVLDAAEASGDPRIPAGAPAKASRDSSRSGWFRRTARPEPEPEARRAPRPSEVTAEEVAAARFASATDRVTLQRALRNLSEADSRVRAKAARSLGSVRHELSVRELLARLVRDPSVDVRVECLDALAQLEASSALPWIEQALADPSPALRLGAVRAHYRVGGRERAQVLASLFADANEDVRRRAVSCVGWLGRVDLVDRFLPVLGDESPHVRLAALDALANLGSRAVVAEVVDLLEDPVEAVRRKAFDVLRSVTGEQMAESFPTDEDERRCLIARWWAWLEGQSSRRRPRVSR